MWSNDISYVFLRREGQSDALVGAYAGLGATLERMAMSWAAASAAARRKSKGARGNSVDDDDGEEEDACGDNALDGASDMDRGSLSVQRPRYNGSEGQQHRKGLVSELRSTVPQAFTHVIVAPLMNCSAFLPPSRCTGNSGNAVDELQQPGAALAQAGWQSGQHHA
jgi:hypothetical protein